MTPLEQTLSQRLSNEARIRELEQLIPLAITLTTNTPLHNRERYKVRLHELNVEYRERVGNDYRVPNPTTILRRHGAGA